MDKLGKAFYRTTQNGEYVAFVDGLRFLAISAVVIFHLAGFFNDRYLSFISPTVSALLPPLGKTGGRGVDLFFILSAFILGLNALKRKGEYSLASFYLRRMRRIFPPFLIAMLLIFVGNVWVTQQFTFNELWPSLVATTTYTYGLLSVYVPMPVLSMITWTLEIEIQFYLLFPILQKVYTIDAPLRRALLLCMSIAFILCRWYFPSPFVFLYDFLPHFFLGMLLADLYYHQRMKDLLPPVLSFLIVMLCFAFVFYYSPDVQENLWSRLVYPFLLFLFFFFSIENKTVRRALSQRLVCLLGGMCYSIYLIHTSVISMMGKIWPKRLVLDSAYGDMSLWTSVIVSVLIVSSSLFYLFIEKPFMTSK